MAVLDKGYDARLIYEACEGRDMRPVIPLKMTAAVVTGWDKPPACDHGTWKFAGSDAKRGASKWRCLTGACTPASRWGQGGPPAPADPPRDGQVEGPVQAADRRERGFGRLKHEWAMLPLRVRRLPRVALHVDLTILAQLADPLTRGGCGESSGIACAQPR